MAEPSEKDYLQYRGNHIPRFIRLAWTLLFVFIIYYLAVNAVPDLKIWLHKLGF